MSQQDSKTLAQELENVQRKLALLVQQHPLCVVEWNTAYQITEWNPAAEHFFGYSRQAAIGCPFAQLWVDKNATAQEERAVEARLERGDEFCNTYQIVQDGRGILCEWLNMPILNDQGQLMGGISMIRDVSDRVGEEKQARYNQNFLNAFIEHSGASIFAKEYTQTNGTYFLANQSFQEQILDGKKPEGKTDGELFPPEIAAAFRQADLQVMEHKTTLQIEELELRPEGLRTSLVTKFPLLDANGIAYGIGGMAMDISDRKRSEQRLNVQYEVTQILAEHDTIQAAVPRLLHTLCENFGWELGELWTVDESVNLLIWAASWHHPALDMTEFDTITKQCVFLPGVDLPGQVWLRQQPIWVEEIAHRRNILRRTAAVKAGLNHKFGIPVIYGNKISGVLVFLTCKAQIASDDLQTMLVSIGRQLGQYLERTRSEISLKESEHQLRLRTTDLEQTLHKLQETQSQLIQSEKMSSLGQLVAGVAHEINNPVNFIAGNLSHADDSVQELLDLLSLYQQETPNPSAKLQAALENIELDYLKNDLPKLFSSMKVGASRIREIVLSLRTFSRLDEAEVKAVDIHDGLNSTLLILQHRLNATDDRGAIQVVQEYGNIPLVECYAKQINQVFFNILSNAIDALEESFLRENGLIPTISIRTTWLGSQRVAIGFTNNGFVIPKKVIKQIFDPFFTTKPIGKGTGMGLAICYKVITETHGGTLKCISTLEKGTEFLIEIPTKL
jgi:two-component system, NtrC family, sensor kinase